MILGVTEDGAPLKSRAHAGSKSVRLERKRAARLDLSA